MSRDSISIALDGVLGCRTSDDWVADFVKLGMARSRIRIGEESNGFREAEARSAHFAKTTPCTVAKSLISLRGPQQRRLLRLRHPYCVFATLGGWAVVMKLVASSIAGPSGVGTFSQNGTKIRVPATGAKAISMLRWAARYLITGRSGM